MPIASEKLEVGIVVNDQLSRALGDLRKKLAELQAPTKSWAAIGERAMVGLWRQTTQLARSVLNLRNAFLAMAAGWAAMKLGNSIAQVETLEEGFRQLVKRWGVDAPTALARMRVAAKGTASDLDMMRSANQAILMGAANTMEQMELLITISRRLGRVMGLDTADSFDRLTRAMGRMEIRVLDDIGLIVKVKNATEKYAKATGQLVSELDEFERREAFWNEVKIKAKDYLTSMGRDVDFVTDKWGRLKAEIGNLWQDVLRGLLPALGGASDDFTKWLQKNRKAILEWIASLLEGAQLAIPAIIEAIKELARVLQILIAPFEKIGLTMASIVEFRAKMDLYGGPFRTGARTDLFSVAGKLAGSGYPGMREAMSSINLTGGGSDEAAARLEDLYRGMRAYGQTVPAEFEAAIRAYQNAERAYMEAAHLRASLEGKPTPGYDDRTKKLELEYLGEAAARLRAIGAAPPPAGPWSSVMDSKVRARVEMVENLDKEHIRPGGLPESAFLPTYDKVLKDTEAEKLKNLQGGLKGVEQGVASLYLRWTDTFRNMYDATLQVGEALTSNITDGFVDAIMGAKSFAQAMKDMAKSIVEDLLRIIIRLVIIRMLSSALGMIPGVSTLAGEQKAAMEKGGANIFDFEGPTGMPTHAQSGGIARFPTLIAEHGQPEAAIPLPDGRRIPVEMIGYGEGGSGTTIVYNINTIDAKSFDEYFRSSAARQPNVIGVLAMRQFQDNRSVRRGMQ